MLDCGRKKGGGAMRPIIGLTPYAMEKEERRELRLGRRYCEQIQAAGGLPLILPFSEDGSEIEQAAALCDGLLFTGGEDLEPALYGEQKLPECGAVDRSRDVFELALMDAAERRGLPVLGICRGIQLINVFYGGTLWQDLESQQGLPKERHSPGHYALCHRMNVAAPSRLSALLGAGAYFVNSSHHQSVKDTPLRITARADDGVIEAIEREGERFVLGVQWHPERMEDGWLFRALVAAARQYREEE